MELNKLDIIPFGAQYYRAPTPLQSEWEEDLRRMNECGFNTIKVLLQWRWNQPAENEYYFDDIRDLLRLCEKFKLKMIINIICDVAPAWFLMSNPDCYMITNSGQKMVAQTTPYR